MGLFWKRKSGSDFISLNLSGPPEAEPEQAQPAPPVSAEPPEPVTAKAPEPEPVARAAAPSPVVPSPVTPPVVTAPPPVERPAAKPEPVAMPEAEPVEDESFLRRFRRAVTKTRENLAERIEDVFKGRRQIDAQTLDELEEALIGADIGVQTTMEIIEDARRQVDRKLLSDTEQLKQVIKQHLLDILERAAHARGVASETAVPDDVRPYVMMIVGVNGVGKTTTIGKLAQRIRAEGNDVLICAADTFRAAAGDQLAVWAERAGVPLIQQKQGTDPAAVLFDSLKAAKARNADVLIVDTAGRLHNKANLMAELEKMKRIAGREVPGAPHETLLVVDAVTGQNGLAQAREFMKAADVTGLVLTKLDGTAKGGIAVAIAKDLNLPIRYCGIGEKADDLVVFDPHAYVDGLFE
ncbi:MAG TPA: signal recognition particle-docking protein FtsY [Blastocatellia bacterium]|nr:signal recognition particle-docking protein FtsY [Blastocatellia bacterium]